MRQSFFLFFSSLTILLFVSCSKSELSEDTISTEYYSIQFNIPTLSSEVNPMTKGKELQGNKNEESAIKAFYLFIYKDQKLQSSIIKENIKTAEELENLSLNLSQGIYTVVAVASNEWTNYAEADNPQEINSSESSFILAENGWSYPEYLGDKGIYFYNLARFEHFYSKFILTVDGSKNNIDLILSRITGKLEIHFTNILPLDNTKIEESTYYAKISLNNAKTGIDFTDNSSIYGGAGYFYLTRAEWSKLSIDPLVFNARTSENVTLKIDFLDQDKPFYLDVNSASGVVTNIINSIQFDNINIYQNKVVKLTGSLNKEIGFNPIINEDWDEIITGELQ